MEIAGVRYFRTIFWRIRNRTSERSERVRFLVQKRRVRMYQTKHFPCGIVFIIYYWDSHHFGGLFISHLSKMLKWERNGSITKTFVKNIMRVRIWGNPRTTSKKKRPRAFVSVFCFASSGFKYFSHKISTDRRWVFCRKVFLCYQLLEVLSAFFRLITYSNTLSFKNFLIQSKRSYYDLLARVKPSYYSFKIFPLF